MFFALMFVLNATFWVIGSVIAVNLNCNRKIKLTVTEIVAEIIPIQLIIEKKNNWKTNPCARIRVIDFWAQC